jgi:fibronectin type 3 domain-containing protein/predicted small lipoprotein YifL
MKRFSLFLVPLLLLFTFVFCGKKGPILPPIKKIPQNVEVFEIAQRGEKLILEWENPSAYADGSSLSEIAEIEIWLAEQEREDAGKESGGENKQISPEEFEKISRLAVLIKRERFAEYQTRRGVAPGKFRYFYELTGKDFTQRSLAFGLIVKDRKKRKSAFSDVISIEPKIISLPPKVIKAAVFKDRIEITWNPPEKNIDQSSPPNFKGYNIYKQGDEGSARLLNSQLVKERKYNDKDILLGEVYHYFLRAVASDSPPLAESDSSDVIEVLAKDTFAPAVPSGLVSIAAEDFISISWDANLEKDLAGYRVWRKMEGEDKYILLTPQPVQENAFNDTNVEKNKRYYYAVSAQDRSGNESPKSESVFQTIKDGFI